MHLMYFTEQPMSAYPAEEGLKFGATALMFARGTSVLPTKGRWLASFLVLLHARQASTGTATAWLRHQQRYITIARLQTERRDPAG